MKDYSKVNNSIQKLIKLAIINNLLNPNTFHILLVILLNRMKTLKLISTIIKNNNIIKMKINNYNNSINKQILISSSQL